MSDVPDHMVLRPMRHTALLLLFNPQSAGGQILAISRGDNLDDWGLVGCKVEPGERLKEALICEVREEVQVKILQSTYDLTPVYTGQTQDGRLTTTFLSLNAVIPKEFPKTAEGCTVAWKVIDELCASACTYHRYNKRLFGHMGLFP